MQNSPLVASTHSNLRDIVLNLHREIFERGKQHAVLQGVLTQEKRKTAQLHKEKSQLQRDVVKLRAQVEGVVKDKEVLEVEVKHLRVVNLQVDALTEEVAQLRKVRQHAVEVETLQQALDAVQEEKNKADAARAQLAEEMDMTRRKLHGVEYLCRSFKDKTLAVRRQMADLQTCLRATLTMLDNWDLGGGTDAKELASATLFLFDDPESKDMTHRLFTNLVVPIDLVHLHDLFNVPSAIDHEERSRRRAINSASTLTSPRSPLWISVREGLCRFWRTTPWQLQSLQPAQLMIIVALFLEHHHRTTPPHTLPPPLVEIRDGLGLASFEEMDGKIPPPTERISRLIQGLRSALLDLGTAWSSKVEVSVDRSVAFSDDELRWLEEEGIYLFHTRSGSVVLRCIHEPHRRLLRPATVDCLLDKLYGLGGEPREGEPRNGEQHAAEPPPASPTTLLPTSELLNTLRLFVGDPVRRLFPKPMTADAELEILGRLSQQLMTTAPHLAIMDFSVAKRTSALTEHHLSLVNFIRGKIQELLQQVCQSSSSVSATSITTTTPASTSPTCSTTPTASAAAATDSLFLSPQPSPGALPIRFSVDVLLNQNLYPCIYIPSAIRVAVIRDNLLGPISPHVSAAISLQISRIVRFRVFVTLHDMPLLTSLQTMEDWQQIMDATAEQIQAMEVQAEREGEERSGEDCGAGKGSGGSMPPPPPVGLCGNSKRFVFGYAQSVCMGLRIHVFAASPRGSLVSFSLREAIDDLALFSQMAVAGMIGLVKPRSSRYKPHLAKVMADEQHVHYYKEQMHDGITAALNRDMISAFS
jgi:hypothetical protein